MRVQIGSELDYAAALLCEEYGDQAEAKATELRDQAQQIGQNNDQIFWNDVLLFLAIRKLPIDQ